jgi:hypothetical protein
MSMGEPLVQYVMNKWLEKEIFYLLFPEELALLT